MEWTLSSFHFSLYKKIMENKKSYYVLAAKLVVFVLFSTYCQWVAGLHVGLSYQTGSSSASGGKGRISSGYTFPKNLIYHDLSRHYIPHNDIHLQKEISTKDGNNDKKRNADIDTFTKRVLESIAKRASYANSEEELKRWKENEDDLVKDGDAGADVGGLGLSKRKRSQLQEYHAGGCVAKIDWKQFDGNHFPRFLKSYNCTSSNCNRNFGECHPKTYIIKVLKRNEALVADEHCDELLPEELRCSWRLEPKNVTTYCECRSNQPLTLYGR